jgi:hypothetical protein
MCPPVESEHINGANGTNGAAENGANGKRECAPLLCSPLITYILTIVLAHPGYTGVVVRTCSFLCVPFVVTSPNVALDEPKPSPFETSTPL